MRHFKKVLNYIPLIVFYKKKTNKKTFPQVCAVMEFQSSSGIKLTYNWEHHGMGFCGQVAPVVIQSRWSGTFVHIANLVMVAFKVGDQQPSFQSLSKVLVC